jgi:plasmid replication initiation protein
MSDIMPINKSLEQYGEELYKNKTSEVVAIHKCLIEACFRMEAQEQKLFLLGLWELSKTPESELPKQIPGQKIIKETMLKREHIIKYANIKETERLKELANSLTGGVTAHIELVDEETGKPTGDWKNFVIVTDTKYEDGVFTMGFHPWMYPYLKNLKGWFARLRMREVKSIQSGYAIRFYMILRQWELVGHVKYELKQLKKILGVQNKYKLYGDFKRYVLNVASRELRENSKLYFSFEEIKTGRKITDIKITIHKNLGMSVSQVKYCQRQLRRYISMGGSIETFYKRDVSKWILSKKENDLSSDEIIYYKKCLIEEVPFKKLSLNFLTDFFWWWQGQTEPELEFQGKKL